MRRQQKPRSAAGYSGTGESRLANQSASAAFAAPLLADTAQQDGPQEGAAPLRHSCSLLDLITHEAPGWGTLLVTDCLDPQARLALLGTCTDTWGLVLETAQHATINVHVSDPVNMATLRAVEGAMQARGKLPTKLHLSATHTPLLTWALDWLKECTTWLDELTVEVLPARYGPDQRLSTTDLATIGRHCPNLRSLHIRATHFTLPKASRGLLWGLLNPLPFPNLKDLAVHFDGTGAYEEGIARSCAPYIKQLTHLTINGQLQLTPTTLPLLLSPGNPGTHLRTLRLPAVLDDMLLSLLLGCAPALEELMVPGIQLQSNAHATTAVQWRRLACVGGHVQRRLRLSDLANLPLAPAMELYTMSCTLVCDMSGPEAEALAGRFKALRLLAIVIVPDGAVAVGHQPAAMRAALLILRTLCVSSCNIIAFSGGWVMSTELMLELDSLPRVSRLSFEHVRWLPATPSYLSLLRWVPDSFTDVGFHGDSITPAQFQLICSGAPSNRTAAAPLHITLVRCAPGLRQDVQDSLRRLLPIPHVTVEVQ